MSDVARSPGKARLLGGVAALALTATAFPALAQSTLTEAQTAVEGPPRLPNPAEHGPKGPDNLSMDELYVEAQSVTRDDEHHALIAKGQVQARYQGRTLRAEEIVYDTQTGLITANGHAEIINADGSVQYAEHLELDDKLQAGVAVGFAARMDQNAKIAAATAIRRSETVNELNRTIFTPCDICNSEGGPKQPTWSIQADKVIQDREKRLIYYRNAVIKVKGVPVFYAPMFWHPDPSAERASGFLMPRVSASQRRGFSWEQPYLWNISPSQDLEISPQINAKVNPFLNLDWRKRFYSGSVEARFGYTYERNFDSEGDKFGDRTSRSYVLANGAFRIDDSWRWGFTADRVSDQSLFDRYDIQDVYEQRGLFAADTRRLTSQVYAVKQTENLYFSVSALSFQTLRPYTVVDPVTGKLTIVRDPQGHTLFENQGAMPAVAPLVEARWEPEGKVLGGRLRVQGSGVALFRDEATLAPSVPAVPPVTPAPCPSFSQCQGVDSARVTGEADWRSSFTTQGGIRIEPFLNARADAYKVSDLDPVTGGDATITRAFGTVGVEVRYPLMRRFGDTTVVVEPVAQGALSPEADFDSRIPNEDSRVFDLDETNLFRPNKFPGYDLYEGGGRLNVGVRTNVEWGDGYYLRAFLGRSFRSDGDVAFAPGTVLRADASDWVVSVNTKPVDGITAWTRARVDESGGAIRRAEVAVNWQYPRTSGFFRYFRNDPVILTPTVPVDVQRRQDIEAAGELLVTKNWGVVFDATRDINNNKWRRSEVGVLYRDECTRAELVYQRNETSVLGKPTDAVYLRLTLATLGNAGYKNYADR
jgi:LPS-assembly protein